MMNTKYKTKFGEEKNLKCLSICYLLDLTKETKENNTKRITNIQCSTQKISIITLIDHLFCCFTVFYRGNICLNNV